MKHEGQINVLLVEDNDGDARLVTTYLHRAEHLTFTLERADRLGKGLERLQEGGIDVVLLDLTLPDSQGIDTFERAVVAALAARAQTSAPWDCTEANVCWPDGARIPTQLIII